MENGEICRWAWEKSKEYRGLLWIVFLILLLFSLPQLIVILLQTFKNLDLPFWWDLPLSWVGAMLGFGMTGVVLKLVMEQEATPGMVFAPFRRDFFKRAALVALFLVVLDLVLCFYPNRLMEQGREIMVQANARLIQAGEAEGAEIIEEYLRGDKLNSRGTLINNIIAIVKGIVLFPLPYLLFLSQEETLPKLLRENLWVLSYNIGWILGIQVRAIAPMVLIVLFALFFLNSGWIMLIIIGITFFLWVPWAVLSYGKAATEMIQVGHPDPWWTRT